MRKDSCRGCGYDLQVFRVCPICEQPSQFQCTSCDRYTDEQIHAQCRRIKSEIAVTI